MTRPINRRQALGALGTVSLGALLAACGDDGGPTTATTTDGATATVEPRSTPGSDLAALLDATGSCTPTAELTEGPYYFDADAIRSDIREDREGVRLRLALRVRDAASCEPVRDAVVDIWHCDAGGVYSGFEAGEGERFLRGTQVSDRSGIVEFVTVYPGWYRGRTVHIHAKVHLDRRTVLTTQLFFDDAVSERVYARAPYSAHAGRDVFNDGDGIFADSLLLDLRAEGDGYLGLLNVDVVRA